MITQGATAQVERPLVLLVDDEPHVLSALSRLLRRSFTVTSASSGQEALALMATEKFAVIISDMRMPEMDGAEFLARARAIDPDAVRLMLTGEGDLGSAASAVNHGEVFRFLRKPCSLDILEAEISAAVERHRSIMAERVLLEQTLSGSVKVLTDVLALASPIAFSRALRVKRIVSGLADVLDVPDRWQVELAAMFSQLGAITVSPETLERAYGGDVLDAVEETAMAGMSGATDQLLANIPRLEPVRAILRTQAARPGDVESLGAKLLRAALAYDTLESAGNTPAACLGVMRGRAWSHDARVLDALELWTRPVGGMGPVREMRLSEVRVGMIFTRDVQATSGLVLIGRGQEVTPSVMQRIRNYWSHMPLKEPPLMQLPVSE